MDSEFGDMLGFLVPLVLIVLAVGFVLGRRGRDGRDLSGPPPANMSMPPPSGLSGMSPASEPVGSGTIDIVQQLTAVRQMDSATLAGIKAAMDSGNKIEAIKLLRVDVQGGGKVTASLV
jgi:hypothetical protein